MNGETKSAFRAAIKSTLNGDDLDGLLAALTVEELSEIARHKVDAWSDRNAGIADRVTTAIHAAVEGELRRRLPSKTQY